MCITYFPWQAEQLRLDLEKQFSTAKDITLTAGGGGGGGQGHGSALQRLRAAIRAVVLANQAEQEEAAAAQMAVDPDLLGKPEPEVEMVMLRRIKSYHDQDQPW